MRSGLLVLSFFWVLVSIDNSAAADSGEKALKEIKSLGIRLNSERWKVTMGASNKGKKLSFVKIKAKSGKKFAFIEVVFPVSEAIASQEIATARMILSNLYKPTPVPYRGQITKRVICEKDQYPQHREANILGVLVPVFLAEASSRLAFGGCIAEAQPYLGAVAEFFMAKSKALVKIRVFIPRMSEASDTSSAFPAIKDLFLSEK